jgi:hypothetical protein
MHSLTDKEAHHQLQTLAGIRPVFFRKKVAWAGYPNPQNFPCFQILLMKISLQLFNPCGKFSK